MRISNRSRRALATLGLLAAISFPEFPNTPKPPEPVPLSLYVWNASTQASEVAVALDGRRLFGGPVAAGRGEGRHEIVRLLPGPHTVEAVAAGRQRAVTITVVPQGNRWIVVTWWGRELDVGLQQSPPWLAAAASGDGTTRLVWLASQEGQGG